MFQERHRERLIDLAASFQMATQVSLRSYIPVAANVLSLNEHDMACE